METPAQKSDTEATVLPAPVVPQAPPGSDRQRLMSLDVFRGITILGMLLVNNIALDTATPRQRHTRAGMRG